MSYHIETSMKNLFFLASAALFAASVACSPLSAQTSAATEPPAERLATIFQDNMILQRDQPVPVWGWAKPGTQVEVAFAGQKKSGKADDKGRWQVILDPLKASASPQELTAKIGSTTETLKNVLVGEVWIVAGHSGTVAGGPNIDTNIYPSYTASTGEGKPEVRTFMILEGAALEPRADLDTSRKAPAWVTLPEAKKEWQSQTEYFARMLRDKLDVPVGIIHPLCLGVLQPTWMPREALESITADNAQGNSYEALMEDSKKRYADISKHGFPQ